MSPYLRPENAFIFRITHVDNVAWILAHGGLPCQSAEEHNPQFVPIGNAELIDKRADKEVPVEPGGKLNDYVPFYFTPHSIMMYNILTGWGSVKQRKKSELVIFTSSLYQLRDLGLSFVCTTQHAYPVDTLFYTDLDALPHIDWALLQRRDFKTTDDDPGKQLRYQAEALVHGHVPLEALRSIVCYDAATQERLEAEIRKNEAEIVVKASPDLYF